MTELSSSLGGWNSYTEGPILAGPMLGEASETEARVWVQARDTSTISLVVSRADGSELIIDENPTAENWLCVTFRVDDLTPGERCTYEIRSRHGATPRHTLRAMPRRDARRLKLAFGSCYWNFPKQDVTIFDAIGREAADLFMLLGDTSYFGEPDWQNERTMMATHLRHRNNNAVRRLIADVPTIGVWDDHDFGSNDCDSTFPGKAAATSAFKRSWANAAYGTRELPGIFGAARIGPVDIIWIDTRTYRIDGSTVLGAAQLEWARSRLARSDAPVKIFASAAQVLPEFPVRHGWNCFRLDAPAELDRLLSSIEHDDIQGVVFLSGDLHMGNLIHVPGRPLAGARRGPELWELTSSPLLNEPWREPQIGTDERLVKEVADQTNYGVVDVDLDRRGREITLSLKNERGGLFFEQPISLADLRVR